MNSYSDKRMLITGASKGLGKAASIAFEKLGVRLALAARSKEKLYNLVNTFSVPEKHKVFDLDLLETENINTLSNTLLKDWDGVDIILHCVGGSMGVNETLVDWDDFAKCLKGNLGIASELNKFFVPNMKKQAKGNIIHVGSIVSYEARASIPYNTTKATISAYVRSLSKELADYGIIVSGILPGAFYGDDNSMFRFEYYKPDEYKEYVKNLPGQRMPTADEYMPMLFLLSDSDSKVMNGSLISMDNAQGQAYYTYSE